MTSDYKIRSVKFNFVMSMIMKISSYIFPLITLPYITRTLGAAANGKISFATSVITYYSMFAQLGIPTYGIRECAKCRDDKDMNMGCKTLSFQSGLKKLSMNIVTGHAF